MSKQKTATEKKIGIYKVTSPSGKIYIGQSIDIERRWREYLEWSSATTGKLKHSFRKYGATSHIFEIIEECQREELNNRERYWQEFYNVVKNGLNHILTETNTKPRTAEFSQEHRENIAKARTGLKLKPQTKEKISKANKGRTAWNKGKSGVQKHSLETREKLSKAKTGKTNPGTLGRIRPESEKQAISKKMKEIWAERLQKEK